MTNAHVTDGGDDTGFGRRQLLRAGGLVAAGAAGAAALTGTAGVAGAQVNAQNVTITEYVPVDPQRVYDSRTSPAIPGGLIHAGQTLTLTTGLDTTIFFGFMWNITVTQTVGKGYFGVFPNDIAWPGNSSINWFTGSEDVSNNCYQRIPTSNGQIQIVCGGTADAAAAIIFDANAAAVFQSVASPTSVGGGALPQFEVVSLQSS